MNTEKQIAYCGLICTDCDAYIATQNDDDEMRKETAATWSKEYNTDIKPEDINCDGCIEGTDRVVGHCHVCEVRKCGQERGVINCAYCGDYACDNLEGFLKFVPGARKTLDDIKQGIK